MLSIANKIDPLIFFCVCFVCDTNYVFPTVSARDPLLVKGKQKCAPMYQLKKPLPFFKIMVHSSNLDKAFLCPLF